MSETVLVANTGSSRIHKLNVFYRIIIWSRWLFSFFVCVTQCEVVSSSKWDI